MAERPIFILIPARGGSKGIIRKNLQTVGGIPLLSRSINAAKMSQVADSICVSTDDDEIRSLALSHDVEVIQRPSELALDTSTSEEAISHFLRVFNLTSGLLVMIQATSPFLSGGDIKALVDTCEKFDTALTVTQSHSFLWRAAPDGSLVGVNHESSVRLRRQDLHQQEFIENGAAYGMDIRGFLTYRHRFFGRIGHVEMPRIRSLEIDSSQDLELANIIETTLE